MVVHILVTSLCNRNCKYCCNKQYDLNDIPYVTDEELKSTDTICLTGGEPFMYSNPNNIAKKYKLKYHNIKNVFVYTNAKELDTYLAIGGSLEYIDGVSCSIKNEGDRYVFENNIVNNKKIKKLRSNRLYVFDALYPMPSAGNFKVIDREWQEDLKPADDSIFRKA